MASTGEAARAGHLPSLDGLRGVAVLTVVFGHAGLPFILGPAASGPGAGVTLFFFLSGYLITTLLRSEGERTGRVSLPNFYLRRLLRIFPPMYVALMAGLVLTLLGVLPDRITPGGLAAAGLQYANYFQIIAGADGLPRVAGVFWSLGVEEHFYLLFPLLYLGLSRATRNRGAHAAILAVLCAFALAWRLQLMFALHADIRWIGMATDTRADSILLGCLFAVIANPALGDIRVSRRLGTWIYAPVGFALLVAPTLLTTQYAMTLGYTLQGIGCMLLFAAVLTRPHAGVGPVLNWRPLVFIGELSYSIYLLHRLAQIPLQETFGVTGWLLGGVSLVVTMAASYVVLRLVERPCARLRRRLGHSATQGARVRIGLTARARVPAGQS